MINLDLGFQKTPAEPQGLSDYVSFAMHWGWTAIDLRSFQSLLSAKAGQQVKL